MLPEEKEDRQRGGEERKVSTEKGRTRECDDGREGGRNREGEREREREERVGWGVKAPFDSWVSRDSVVKSRLLAIYLIICRASSLLSKCSMRDRTKRSSWGRRRRGRRRRRSLWTVRAAPTGRLRLPAKRRSAGSS